MCEEMWYKYLKISINIWKIALFIESNNIRIDKKFQVYI